MTQMTATKMLTYDNRRLVPGEDFVAKSHRDMKLLLATRKAKVKRLAGEVPAPPAVVMAQLQEVDAAKNDDVALTPEEQLQEVRTLYEAKFGKRPYYGWDIEQLREKIAAAPSED